MRYLFIVILFSFQFVTGQTYSKYDTITDINIAIQKLQQDIKKNPVEGMLYCFLAERLLLKGRHDSSIYYSNKSIDIFTKGNNNNALSRAYHIKGNAQYYLDDKPNAEASWRQALQLAWQVNDYKRVIKLSSNLGAIYLDQGYVVKNNSNYKRADSFFRIAYEQLNATDSLNSEQGLLTLRLMATSLHFQKKYDSADYYYKKIVTLSKNRNPGTYLGAITFYAEMLSETGRHEEALAYAKEGMQFAIANNVLSKDRIHATHVYAKVLYDMGNYKEAYRLNDSSYQQLATDYEKVNAQAYAESESKFKNQLLQYQVALEKQKQNRLYFLIAGLVLLTGIGVLSLINRNNKRIAKEKARQKQISIDAFIEGEEKEKVRIGRELHDGIAQEIVAVKLAMQQQKTDPKLIEELNRLSLDIRNISHELMPQTLKDYGLKIAIDDICQKILSPSGIQYEVHTTLPEERISNKIEITLYRVFQELVHNIIKHSQATEVLVQLRKMNNHVLLIVEDNGKGITTEKNAGIGINNLKSRVQLLDGSLQYDSGENEGTTAIVRVPVQ